ncbi:hypothetical protein ACVWZ4_002841 [Bradyrhizobium sp. USDA 4472]
MGRVVRLVQFDRHGPSRPRSFSSKILLVALFPDDKVLVAFAQHLYREHGILTVDDWDDRGRHVLESYAMDIRSKRRFVSLVGVPIPARNKPEGIVLSLCAAPAAT